MALSPELKHMVSGATTTFDPLAAKRAEILARTGSARVELARIAIDEADDNHNSIREQLAWLGLRKATKSELREIILKAMERD